MPDTGNIPASPEMQRKMKMHVTYDYRMHATRSRRELDRATFAWVEGNEEWHDTIIDTICGIGVCYQRRHEKQVLFDPTEKPLTCIICIAES